MREQISPQLRDFVADIPFVRRSILRFLQDAATTLPRGTRVLDAGAGDAPYRELFTHCHYLTADFAATDYHDFRDNQPDIVCDLASIPLDDATQDAVLCTEVLEHIADPLAVLRELRRLLVPGGHLFVTTPFVWELHEQPYDYYRYTPFALQRLFEQAGFQVESMTPRGGFFTTLALMIGRSHLHFHTPYLRPSLSARYAGRVLRRLLPLVAKWISSLDSFDPNRAMTVGYACHCVAPNPSSVSHA